MSLKVSDMVLIPQGVYLLSGDEHTDLRAVITAQPMYGIIISEKHQIGFFKDHFPVAVGDIRYFAKEEDMYPCSSNL